MLSFVAKSAFKQRSRKDLRPLGVCSKEEEKVATILAIDLPLNLFCEITDFVKLFRGAEINSARHTNCGVGCWHDDLIVILRAKPEEYHAGKSVFLSGNTSPAAQYGIISHFECGKAPEESCAGLLYNENPKVCPLEGDSAEQKAPGGAFCEREGTKCRRGLDKDIFLPRFFALNILRHLIGEKYKVST